MVWVLMVLLVSSTGAPSQSPAAVYPTERACQAASAKLAQRLPRKGADGQVAQKTVCLEVPMHPAR
jgi:hypothetical protein